MPPPELGVGVQGGWGLSWGLSYPFHWGILHLKAEGLVKEGLGEEWGEV